jgi:hypothetical protein
MGRTSNEAAIYTKEDRRFEPTAPAFERCNTVHALNFAVPVISLFPYCTALSACTFDSSVYDHFVSAIDIHASVE